MNLNIASAIAQIDEMVPIVAIVCVFGGPMVVALVAMLLKHQREMANALKTTQISDAEVSKEVSELRNEVRELKEVILSHSLSLDSNVDSIRRRVEHISEK